MSETATEIELSQLALQIGITGHRHLSLDNGEIIALEQIITDLLKGIASSCSQMAQNEGVITALGANGLKTPRLLSALAEGADTLAATAALSIGYKLHCPLPFPREIYQHDFRSPDTLATYHSLMAQAERVLELDGSPAQKDRAYRASGETILRQADILLAVWDGVQNDASPGTAGMVAAAIQHGVPVLWLPVNKCQPIQLHDPSQGHHGWQAYSLEKLEDVLRWRLLPPELNQAQSEPQQTPNPHSRQTPATKCGDLLETYLKHETPRLSLIGSLLIVLMSGFVKLWQALRESNYYLDNAKSQWQALANSTVPPLAISQSAQERFVHADSLACYYADQYRGTFILCFLLGGIAVLLALLGAPFQGAGHAGLIYAFLELATILLIAGLIIRGRLIGLHQRWVDFRLLAERFRQWTVLAPIGSQLIYKPAPFDSHGDQTHVLIDWLMRAHNRNEGMPSVKFDASYRNLYRQFLLGFIQDQARYHHHNAERNEHVAHRLHGLNYLFLFLIIVFCSLHIVCGLFASHLPDWLCHHPAEMVFTLVTAVLPAFGAAVAGILSQGEFERIALRSQGMAKHLAAIAKQLEQHKDISVLELSRHAHEAIDIMNQELSDWRVIFRAKTLEMHA